MNMDAPEMINAFYDGANIRAVCAQSGQIIEENFEWLLRGYMIGLRSRQDEGEDDES